MRRPPASSTGTSPNTLCSARLASVRVTPFMKSTNTGSQGCCSARSMKATLKVLPDWLNPYSRYTRRVSDAIQTNGGGSFSSASTRCTAGRASNRSR
jgi:hypothetical protein